MGQWHFMVKKEIGGGTGLALYLVMLEERKTAHNQVFSLAD
jgi:hypothetical protein